jgi:hypothetical protein
MIALLRWENVLTYLMYAPLFFLLAPCPRPSF